MSSESDSEDGPHEVYLTYSGFLEKDAQDALDSFLEGHGSRVLPRQYAGQTADFANMFTGKSCWQPNAVAKPSAKLRRDVTHLQSVFASRILSDPLVAIYNNPSTTYPDDRKYFCEACAVFMPAREQDWQMHSTGFSHQCHSQPVWHG